MAKNDYDVIVYKILLYYYAIMKREIVFGQKTFDAILDKRNVSDEYLADIIRLMKAEGLIEGVTIMKAWGTTYIIASDLSDVSITAEGIRYLKENAAMTRVKDTLLSETPGITVSLISKVFGL